MINNVELPGMPAKQAAPIVAFAGRAGVGKTTAASVLVNRGWVRLSFAGPLKAACLAMFPHWTPLHMGAKKEDVDPVIGVSPRVAMQTLGTDWGRNLNPDLWVNLLRAQVEKVSLHGAAGIVIDDVRFINEVLAVQALGGRVLVVARKDAPEVHGHESETLQGVWEASDGTLHNDGTPEGLVSMLDHCLENLGVVEL